MTTTTSLLRCALLACAALAVAACASAEAAPPATAPVYEPHPAMAIADRLSGEGGVPDLSGLAPEQAAQQLAAAGMSVQVIAYDEGAVSAQYPGPGASPPADGVVIVWTGTPPVPPPPPPRPSRDVARAEPPPPEPEPEPAPQPEQPAATDTASAPPAASAAPAAGDPNAPHPPRTSPRRMPATAAGTVLEGPASWYGEAFAGRNTACGDIFDPGQLTLATRELRCGTKVRITGPSGASVEAVATDWGPAEWTNRRFDLSQATFAAIHPLGAGVVNVSVEVLD